MRKILICLSVAFAVLSCASVRRATPIAVEDIKQYPTTQEGVTRPAVPPPMVSAGPEDATPTPEPVQEETVPQGDTSLVQQIIAYARTFTGTPYRLGAAGPKEFDCSHFTSYVFGHFGYTLTAFSQAQFREGREVPSYADLQLGDLVFFGTRGSVRNIGHVGIVVSINRENGSFNFIHASVSKGVTEDNSNHPYFMMRYMGARRVLPDESI